VTVVDLETAELDQVMNQAIGTWRSRAEKCRMSAAGREGETQIPRFDRQRPRAQHRYGCYDATGGPCWLGPSHRFHKNSPRMRRRTKPRGVLAA